MAVPDFQSFFLPMLQLSSDGNVHSLKEAYEALANHFKLTDADMLEMLPSGKQAVYKNRIAWARAYLAKALLLESPKRGVFCITERGKELLASKPVTLRVQHLKQYPEFVAFHQQNGGADAKADTNDDSEKIATPEETFEAAYQEMRGNLAAELLSLISANSPAFFEQLVIKLLVRMGYGGSIKDAGMAVGKTGDGGIDGIIKEDKLGLDVIYIQAKRWQGVVGRPEIQKFVGALHGQRAKRGVFITTSSFTRDAEQYVATIDPRVVLIDGNKLVDLMIDYDLGVATIERYDVKRIDSDFFLEG
ncbi:restriction endonuclease [Desulfobulbus propionicus DSM 2032]|uniref:Restriction endonuclease n=1 Tax=Desulfobulbus propionicus (strain ATCC 33891 / DSM 2032 / VKM B-1956 / 1pr3) TaxID=577650 RepID=A0A7U3YPP9_DESPD|nr:restriction endonuclease [Desulfobulbus propionicus]ADW19265.1 restriction endonuclease [Desulfobulbus propionicus DSM 2032]